MSLPDRQNHISDFKIAHTREVKRTKAYFNPREAFVIKTIDIKGGNMPNVSEQFIRLSVMLHLETEAKYL